MIATSLGSNVAAWLLFPAVLYALVLGVGLLTVRLLRVDLPNALLAPVGFCVSIVVIQPGYRLGASGWLAVGLLVAAALAGYLLTGRRLRARLNPRWAGLAGAATYALYVAPVALSGGWTWAGYNFVNDTAIQFLLVDHVQHLGAVLPTGMPTTTLGGIRSYIATHYPLGSHEMLASLDLVVRMPVYATYQPFIAAMAALAAMALASVISRVGVPGWAAGLVAFVALAANLTYNYALQGNIKEIAMVCTLAVSAAVARELLAAHRLLAPAIALGLCLAAALAVYSAAAVPYIFGLAAAVGVAMVVQSKPALRDRTWRDVPALGAGVAALGIAALPVLTQIVTFGEVARGTFSAGASVSGSGASALGQLTRPLKLGQAAGVWLGAEYRTPISSPRLADLTDVAIWVVVALLAIAVVWLLRRRETGPLLYLAAAALTLAVIAPRVSPYADAKMLAIVSPGVVLVAGLGVVALGRRWLPVGALLGLFVAAAVLGSDARAYHDVRLAPLARMNGLHDAGRHLRGRGLVLVDEFEEFAKYFARPAAVNVATEAITPFQISLRRRPHTGIYGYQFDLDLQKLRYVERFPAILQRRSPAASRPPANYRLLFQNRYYEDWVRTPRPRILDHLPAWHVNEATAHVRCSDIRGLARRARGDEWLVAATGPQVAVFDTAGARDRSPGWLLYSIPGLLSPDTPGFARGVVRAGAGTYWVWLRGTFGRRMDVYVDGRKVGQAHGVDTPNSWSPVARLRLSGGAYRVEVRRPGVDLAPGDGAETRVGPLDFERAGSRRLEWVRPPDAARLCGRALDWVELVRR